MSVGKKIRFEVFKRDKFTCQYCGRSAPDVVLHADHIMPVSKGGDDDITNLVTSCQDCNLGKSNRLLSDDAAIKKKKKQLDELQERREQLEMMMEWQRSLLDLEDVAIEEVSEFWSEVANGYHLNESGLKNLGKWVKRFGVNEVCKAMRVAADTYFKYGDQNKITHESVETAWSKVPGICYNDKRAKEKPYLRDLYYIRGILRNRCYYVNKRVMQILEDAHLAGWDIEEMKDTAKRVNNWTEFKGHLLEWIEV